MANSPSLASLKAKAQTARTATTNAAKKVGHQISTGAKYLSNKGHQIFLSVPKDYNQEIGSGLNDLVKAADELGIQVQNEERDNTALTKEIFGTTEKLLGFTERGIFLSAPQVDKLIQKHQKLSKHLESAENIGGNLGKAQGVLSSLQNILGITLSGIELDDLIKKQKNGEDVSQTDLAKASIDLVNQLVDTASSVAGNIDSFSDNIKHIGEALKNTKYLNGLGNKLQNIPDVGKLGNGLDAVSGILGAVSASLILANKDAHAGTKAAAGVELTTKVLGNVGKVVSQYVIAQRVAAGLSTTAATAGLIASAVSLAISPLSFLAVADKFKNAKEIETFGERFKKLGYEGDSLLASFHKQSGAIDATLTTITTALNAVSAGVNAAAAGSVVGAPVGALVTLITGAITGILEASKQAMFEHVASKLANEIKAWEEKHKKNYFENGYDARHAAFLEDSFKLLSEFNKTYEAERAILITQQRWDEKIGELAGITRNAANTKSGKAYVDYFEEGKRLEKAPNEFTNQVFDPLKGEIDLATNSKASTLLKFVTPTLTAGEEIRERKQSGKYQYVTELLVKGKKQWVVKGVLEHGATYDYSNLIQHVQSGTTEGNTQIQYTEIKIQSNLGKGNDKIFLAAGSSEVNAGEGHDVVYYDKTDTGLLTIDGSKSTKAGNYTVHRKLHTNEKLLREVVKEQEVSVGKRTEKIQYRDFEFAPSANRTLEANDTLHSVEEIIGSNNSDTFIGSNFADIFHGASGNDILNGNDGDDRLYGDDGNDELRGGAGNDQLYGGTGNDKLFGDEGNNYLSGGDGDDELQVKGYGFNVLRGGKGNDKLYGGSGADYLEGGEGDDYLAGGDGSDFYLYSSKSGKHTISEIGNSRDVDKLYLADLSFDRLFAEKSNDNLVLRSYDRASDYDLITFKDWFKSDKGHYKVEEIFDKDGRKLTSENIEKYIRSPHTSVSLRDSSSLDATNLNKLSSEVNKIISSAGSFNITGSVSSNSNSLSSNNLNDILINTLARA
ncbi:RTX family hemolysin [Actinobacillus vicugnae]|uniref:RTX family hemolysin n=1 Tax=Actinobacillus vicugnae TaxID=2573093 RepID=UPI0012401F2F|nr:RTX family hemolysin [Actinobacillus vicugnae]